MNEVLKDYYNIDVITIISVSSSSYKIKAKQGSYFLKYVTSSSLENIINKLAMLHIDTFNYIIKNNWGYYVTSNDDISFILSNSIEEDNVDAKEIKMKMFINKIANLHSKSFFTLDVSKDFFIETFEFIENKLIDVSSYLEQLMEMIEKEDYKSPFEWMFVLNYGYLKSCMDKSYDYLQKFKTSCENKTSIRMVLAYLNFDYSHILVKKEKIISIENMVNAPPIYDIVDMIDKGYSNNFDLSSVLEQYHKVFPLQEYEKMWLLALLFIPKVNFNYYSDIDLIKQLIDILEYNKCIEKIESIITK
ncbi:MAG: hypothetical protein E7184_01985 [Erysipelotrichaceae bacterium]|nr:hypothetical protein [Erysipelotrichaceae bacterium]